MPPPPRVLLIGYRRAPCEALASLEVPYVLWADRRRRPPGATHVHVEPIPTGRAALRETAETLRRLGPFTHVIAATEAAVVAAGGARRTFGARASPTSTVLRCADKLVMKRYLRAAGIPMTDFRDGNQPIGERELFETLGSPVVVKTRTGSGSRDIAFAADAETLRAIPRRNRILERFVRAEEASVETFVRDGRPCFESLTEYRVKAEVNVVPAQPAPELERAIRDLNRRVIHALRIRWGVTHLELYLTGRGPLFGEIALRPPGGYIMDLLRLAYGFDAWQAFIAIELELPFEFPQHLAPAAAAAIVLHPGPGRVVRVAGLDRVRAHPCVHDVELRVKERDLVKTRRSTGEHVGRVLLRAERRDELLAAVDDVRRRLVIEVDQAGA